MCYTCDSLEELERVVDAILRDEVFFVVGMRGETWAETTLLNRGQELSGEAGITYKVVSWTSKHDRIVTIS
jgi:hypothetical protein